MTVRDCSQQPREIQGSITSPSPHIVVAMEIAHAHIECNSPRRSPPIHWPGMGQKGDDTSSAAYDLREFFEWHAFVDDSENTYDSPKSLRSNFREDFRDSLNKMNKKCVDQRALS